MHTLLAIELGDRDPGIRLRIELIKEWCKFWAKNPIQDEGRKNLGEDQKQTLAANTQ